MHPFYPLNPPKNKIFGRKGLNPLSYSPYCWWFRNPEKNSGGWYLVYPIIWQSFIHPNAGCLGCLPLTVSPGNNKTASIFGSFGTWDLGNFSASEMVILGGRCLVVESCCVFLQHNLGIKTLKLLFFLEVMNSHFVFNDLYLWVKLNAYCWRRFLIIRVCPSCVILWLNMRKCMSQMRKSKRLGPSIYDQSIPCC